MLIMTTITTTRLLQYTITIHGKVLLLIIVTQTIITIIIIIITSTKHHSNYTPIKQMHTISTIVQVMLLIMNGTRLCEKMIKPTVK